MKKLNYSETEYQIAKENLFGWYDEEIEGLSEKELEKFIEKHIHEFICGRKDHVRQSEKESNQLKELVTILQKNSMTIEEMSVFLNRHGFKKGSSVKTIYRRILPDLKENYKLKKSQDGKYYIENLNTRMNFNKLLHDIFNYDPDGPNIHHLMAVHSYSRMIAQMENVDAHTLYITEAAAYLHDIGVKISKEKYGNSEPQHQEAEGPIIARELLLCHQLPEEDVERICFIIGHHHTYKAIDGIDFQILVEADYIVNLMEGYCKRDSIPTMKENVFKTKSGKYLLEKMFN